MMAAAANARTAISHVTLPVSAASAIAPNMVKTSVMQIRASAIWRAWTPACGATSGDHRVDAVPVPEGVSVRAEASEHVSFMCKQYESPVRRRQEVDGAAFVVYGASRMTDLARSGAPERTSH